MEMQWYYSHDDSPQGPVDGSELKELAKSGTLAATDWLWNDHLTEWVAAGRIKGLEFQTPSADALRPAPQGIDPAAAGNEAASKARLGRFLPATLVTLAVRIRHLVGCRRASTK
jgi:hypothetical protein